MKNSVNITADGTTEICEIHRTVGLDMWEASVFVFGSFGAGTVTLQASSDGGTTKIDLRDISGALVSITADDVYNLRLGSGNNLNDKIKIYAKMAGSTTPTVTVDSFDNR